MRCSPSTVISPAGSWAARRSAAKRAQAPACGRSGSTYASTGEITWPTLSYVHRIRGAWKGGSFPFTETVAICPGSAHLRCTHSATVSAAKAQGSYIDTAENGRGTVVIHNK